MYISIAELHVWASHSLLSWTCSSRVTTINYCCWPELNYRRRGRTEMFMLPTAQFSPRVSSARKGKQLPPSLKESWGMAENNMLIMWNKHVKWDILGTWKL